MVDFDIDDSHDEGAKIAEHEPAEVEARIKGAEDMVLSAAYAVAMASDSL